MGTTGFKDLKTKISSSERPSSRGVSAQIEPIRFTRYLIIPNPYPPTLPVAPQPSPDPRTPASHVTVSHEPHISHVCFSVGGSRVEEGVTVVPLSLR